jgi:hypothetical protein
MGDIVDFRRLALIPEPVELAELPSEGACDLADDPSTAGLVIDEPWTPRLLPSLSDEQRLVLRHLHDEILALPADDVMAGPKGRVKLSDSDYGRLAEVYERLGVPYRDDPVVNTWRQRHLAAQGVVAQGLRTLLRQDDVARGFWNHYPPGLVRYLQAVAEDDAESARALWSGVEGRFVFLRMSELHAQRAQNSVTV